MREPFRASHAVALLLGFVGGALIVWSFKVRAERHLVQQRDSLAVQIVRLDSVVAEHRADTVTIREQRDVIRWRAGRVDSLLDTLLMAAPDSLRPIVVTLENQVRAERRDRDSLVTLLTAQITWRDSAITALTQQRNRAMQLLDVAIRKNRRCGIGGAAPFGLNTRGGGWGAAVGVACRL